MALVWRKIGEVNTILRCYNLKKYGKYFAPCGKCAFCRQRVSSDWAIRVDYESRGKHCYNVLLTYDSDNLPYYFNKPCVERVDIQLFLKRLRFHLKKWFDIKFRYFGVAEYGGEFGRPHYHVILFFNEYLNPEELKVLIYNSWRKGGVNCEDLINTDASSVYMTLYLSVIDTRDYNKFTKPFRFMSKSLGIDLLEDASNEELLKTLSQNNYSSIVHNGYEKGLPRYYRNKLLSSRQKEDIKERYEILCKNFSDYLLNLNENEKQFREQRLRAYQCNSQKREFENFRKIKVQHLGNPKYKRHCTTRGNRSAESFYGLYFG